MKKKLITYLLMLALTFSIIAPSKAYAATNEKSSKNIVEKTENEGEIIHGSTHFEDIEYLRPDFVEMVTTILKITPLLSMKNQGSKIKELYDQVDAELTYALTMRNYLNIKTSHDVTNNELIEEYSYVASNISAVTNLYCLVCIEIVESSYASVIRDEFTDEEIQELYELSKLLTPEYIELNSKINDLTSQYRIALATATVDVNGVAMTESDLYYNEDLSEEEFYNYQSIYMDQLNQTAGKIYLELVDLYKKLASLSGFDNVTEYMYDSYDRDYSPRQARQFHRYVKEYIVPLYKDLASTWTEDEVNLILQTSADLNSMDSYFIDYFKNMSNNMLDVYKYMKRFGLFSAGDNQNRQQSNYTTYLYSLEQPYMSLYTTGYYSDITTFIHEFGHFNAYYINGADLGSNIDICEIHSQANEMLFMPYYQAYGDAFSPIVKNQILSMLSAIIQGSLYDEFQQYVYKTNITSVRALNEAFFELECDYGLVSRSSGYTQDLGWIYVNHSFEAPLYYISYGMSAIPALDIFTKSLTDREDAIQTYNELVDLGTGYPFLQLLKKTELASPFKKQTYQDLSDTLYDLFNLNQEEIKPAA